jgi:hypothetical protein
MAEVHAKGPWSVLPASFDSITRLQNTVPVLVFLRPLSDHQRESFRERFLPFDTRLARLSKSRDPEVTGPCERLVRENSGGSKENVR